MTPQRRKMVLTLFTTACLVGLTVALFLGYQLFQTRMKIFWLFSAYISALTGVVLFFGFRLIGGGAAKGD
jgi:ABC-type arginine/histidine transport system permease subunit